MERLKKIHKNLHSMIMPSVIMLIVLESIEDIEEIPESNIYLPLNSQGLNIDQFSQMMNILKESNAITVKSHYVTKGTDYQGCVDRLNKLIDLCVFKSQNPTVKVTQNA